MKISNLKYSLIAFTWLLVIQSCTDGEEMAPQNMAPTMTAQSFNVSEAAISGDVLDNVSATDPDGDALSFSITANDNDLFTISSSGALSLATGQSLDFETATSHTVTVSVSDGELTAEADMTITVTDENENTAPEISAQSFTVAEDITDADAIGTVTATGADGDALTFSISTNDNDLFELTPEGELSLATGKSLDFETTTVHTITITVTDGELTTQANMTINVTDVDETTLSGTGFITTWKTTSPDESITIPTNPDFTYNYSVDWGDGAKDEELTGNANHTYAVAGTYTVEITGSFPAIYFKGGGDKNKILSIERWGNIQWRSMEDAFGGCALLASYNAMDTPDLSDVTSMTHMFYGSGFNGDLSDWDVSNVEDMSFMFAATISFNGDISTWDVSSVTNMNSMFSVAILFNRDISDWDVSSVENMASMFGGATSFNSDISDWDVSNVENMAAMFSRASTFNRDISGWDVSSVENMNGMFALAVAFRQDISSWDTSQVKICAFFAPFLPAEQWPTKGCFE